MYKKTPKCYENSESDRRKVFVDNGRGSVVQVSALPAKTGPPAQSAEKSIDQ